MKAGKPHGTGVYFDKQGFRYEGDWRDGRFEGRGRLQLPNGDEYVGSFRAGKADGEGHHFQSDGENYVGEFKVGLRDGSAQITLPNRYSYRSQWANSRRSHVG
jgi:hypothetical protein